MPKYKFVLVKAAMLVLYIAGQSKSFTDEYIVLYVCIVWVELIKYKFTMLTCNKTNVIVIVTKYYLIP